MILYKPSVQLVHKIDGVKILAELDTAARTCYKSEGKMTVENLGNVVKSCIKNGHTSILEHVQLSFILCLDQGVLRELTRHRHASYSVESTRYCKYDKGVKFIEPIEFKKDSEAWIMWRRACNASEGYYQDMLSIGCQPQEARSVLNLSVACEMRFSINLRSLRNLLTLRCAKGAHAHIKEIFIPMLLYLQQEIPYIFDDITFDEDFYNQYLSDNRWESYITEDIADGEWEEIIEGARNRFVLKNIEKEKDLNVEDSAS
jgi:thymidylate synthase (FAD)